MARPSGRSHNFPEYSVLGVRVHAVQIPDVLREIENWIAQRSQCRYIAVTGMHGITEAQHDSSFHLALAAADLVVPDGMPLIWLGRRHGYRLPRRVYGPELMHTLWERTATKGYRHFFYGGAPGVAEALAEKFLAKFPGHYVAGTFSPPFRSLSPDEDEEIVRAINESGADIVWVGLGTPKQEHWMHEHRNRLQCPVLVGVGAAFDFHTGRVRCAPAWMGENGLEWLFRLSQEPRRLWRRYLLRGGEFTALALLEQFRLKKFD
jgi:N-acetylglucosaminyldiphosphoundecaprenol N-acetyl-beta-D-mannosaminyltransferase